MNRDSLAKHLTLCLAVLPIALLTDSLLVLTALCVVDIVLLGLAISDHGPGRRLNGWAPSLWATLGYVLYGQLPIIVNSITDSHEDFSSLNSSIVLILVGYRAVLAGILVYQPKLQTVAYAPLPSVSIWIALLCTVAGGAIRMFHNNFGTAIGDWAWYYALPFSATPVGITLAIAYLGQHRTRHIPNRSVVNMVFGLAVLCAVVDVSRKDSGAALTPIVICIAFGFRPQRPLLRMTFRSSAGLIGAGLALGIVLMATRSYPWAIQNKTDLKSEVILSYSSRRANDVTNELAFVMETTPSTFPFLRGWTFLSLTPIPRVIWSGRPPAHSYYVGLQRRGMFEYDFNPQMMGAHQLSISAHLLGEGYANFGYAGAIGIELVYGLLVGLFESLLRAGRLVTLRILLPTILFFTLTQQRGDLAMMNTGWLMSAGVLWAILIAVRVARGGNARACIYGTTMGATQLTKPLQQWTWMPRTRRRESPTTAIG